MQPETLAEEFKKAMDKDSEPTSDETKGLAKAIIEEVSGCLVSFAVGSITGVAPPSGGPVSNGAGSGGSILLVTGSTLSQKMQLNMGLPSVTSQLQQMADGIANHISSGRVSFQSGNITGVCANSPTSPGPFTGGGAQGKIEGLSDSSLASGMAAGLGGPPTDEIKKMAKAIVDHIKTNAIVSFTMGGLTGLCSAGGGPIQAGGGIGGKAS